MIQAGCFRIELQGSAELRQGGGEIRLLQVRRSQVSLEGRIAGAKPYGLSEFRDGSVGLPALQQSQRKVVVSLRIARSQLDHLGESGNRALGITAALQQEAEAGLRRHEIRL